MNFAFFKEADVSWWDPTNPQDKRSFVYQKQLNWVNQLVPVNLEGKALDIGAGRGRYTRLGLNKGYDITSVDVNPQMFKVMQKSGLKNPMLVMNGEKLDFKPKTFDIVFAMEVVMHVKDLPQFLAEIHRVLKPKGIAFLNITNKRSLYPWWVTRVSPPLRQDQRKYPRIQYLPEDFTRLVEGAGFKIKARSGYGVVPPLSLAHQWKGTVLPKWLARATSHFLDPFWGEKYGFCMNYMVRKR